MARPAPMALLFFGSGAVALCFEALWFAQAGLAFGNGVWASSLVLAGFMAGMALGYLWAARYAGELRHPLRTYALLELMVALSGVALVYALPDLGAALAPLAAPLLTAAPLALRVLHFCFGFVLLVLPSFAMGATLPIATRAVASAEHGFGRVLGVLYGANTLGAMCGVLATHLVLVERCGIRGSALLAGAIGLCIAGTAFALSRGAEPVPIAAPPARLPLLASAIARLRVSLAFWIASALAGFALLALEVIWFRFLLLFLNDTPLAFAVVLAVVLAGIGLGSLLAARLAERTQRPQLWAALVAYAGGVLALAGYLVYPSFLQGKLEPDQGVLTVFRIAAPLVLPTSLASGALFPLLGAGLRREVGADAATVGQLGMVNTVGAALGSLLGGFVLLPELGMERSFACLFVLYGVIGACLHFKLWRGAPLLVFAACMLAFPYGRMRSQYVKASTAKWLSPEATVEDVREGLTSTLVHIVHRHDGVPLSDQLVTNSYSMTSNGFFGRRYMELFVYLPVALHPHVERALVIGYGMGNTAAALTRTRELSRIDVVDVSRDMLEESRQLQSARGPSPLDDPRVHVFLEDGRFFLQANPARYDLITGEPPPPIMAGVVNLYSTEYFALVRNRLREGGIASYWLPLMNISAATAKSIVRGFCEAFEDCSLWHGSSRNFMLLGTRGRRTPVTAERFTAQWRDPTVKRALAHVGFELHSQLPALFIGDAAYLRELTRDAKPLTDDWPRRMHQPGSREERDALIDGFRDVRAARARFEHSTDVARLVPPELREQSLPQFDTQSLLDALTYPESTALLNSQLLHAVMRKTTLRVPVLLLLGSSPDYEAALASVPRERAQQPAWTLHRAASSLADRDLAGALDLLEAVPNEELPMPDLTDYVAYALQRSAGSR